MIKKLQRWTLIILFLAVMRLYSALNNNGNYYPQVFLKECKYIKKKIIRHIIDDSQKFY